MQMDEKQTQELLLRLLEDMAVVKSKLDIIEEMRLDAKALGGKIEKLEMQNERHEKSIASLENRSSTMEQFVRNGIADSKRQQTSVFISMGMAVFSAIVSFVFAMFR